MRHPSTFLGGLGLCLAASACLTGCARKSDLPPTPPAPVTVSQPSTREVTDFEYFDGRTEAVESVEVRARVNGYLDWIYFTEGAEVKKGDPLFLIDPRPYEAELAKSEGEVGQTQATLKRLNADFQRAQRLVGTTAMSREEFDKIAGDRSVAEASLAAAQAATKRIKLNLEWTKVTAPISGKISRALITVGNLVTADTTLLTTINSMEPMYAYFPVDERTVLHVKKMIREGKVQAAQPEQQVQARRAAAVVALSMLDGGDFSPLAAQYFAQPVIVYLGLDNERDQFPHKGIVDFADNRVDRSTGTVLVRGIFPNSDRSLFPGLHVRIKLPLGSPRKALLVPERSLGTDQGQKYVFVVNEQKEVENRIVQVGVLQEGMREVVEGLKPSDWVITNGLMRVRPGVTVDPHPAVQN